MAVCVLPGEHSWVLSRGLSSKFSFSPEDLNKSPSAHSSLVPQVQAAWHSPSAGIKETKKEAHKGLRAIFHLHKACTGLLHITAATCTPSSSCKEHVPAHRACCMAQTQPHRAEGLSRKLAAQSIPQPSGEAAGRFSSVAVRWELCAMGISVSNLCRVWMCSSPACQRPKPSNL